jgi:hypothetical protein
MKKYKFITKDNYLDQVNDIAEKYQLSKEEKEEVNILISRYGSFLQKINECIENDKLKIIKDEILKKIKEQDV